MFERGSSFDPRIDSLVRVEAARLRSRLKAYYDGEGRTNRVRIEVPAGSYVPVFRIQSERGTGILPRRRIPPLAVVAAGLALAAILALVWIRARPASAPALSGVRRITSGPGLSIQPSLDAQGKLLAYASTNGTQGPLKIWLRDLTSGASRQITDGEGNDGDPSLSADGTWLAYHSDLSGGGLYVMPVAGGKPRLLAAGGRSARFSPRNSDLAYWIPPPYSAHGRAYMQAADGTDEPDEIAREFEDVHNITWTPDGEHFLFCGTRRSNDPNLEHDFWVVSRKSLKNTKTGALPELARKGLNPHRSILGVTEFAWDGDGILFAAESAGEVDIWRIPISSRTWTATGEASLVHSGAQPSTGGGHIAFAGLAANLDIWSAPVDVETGTIRGALQRLTSDPAVDVLPSASCDGKAIAFLSNRGPYLGLEFGARSFRIWTRDDATGLQRPLAKAKAPTSRLTISCNTHDAFYRIFEGSGAPYTQAIYRTNMASGETSRVCENCGSVVSASRDGRLLIYEVPASVERIAAFDVAASRKIEVLRHPHHAVRSAALSPDGRWIAFVVDRGPEGKRVHVAPFSLGEPIPEQAWKRVSESEGDENSPAWSPDGLFLYFLSASDRHHCIWGVPFENGNLRPQRPVLHLHESSLFPSSLSRRGASRYVGLAATPARLLMSLGQVSSDLWLGETLSK